MKQKPLTPAQQQQVLDNMDFAKDLAKTFTRDKNYLPDLQQESLYGLCQAAARFRPRVWCRLHNSRLHLVSQVYHPCHPQQWISNGDSS